jgi:cation/acetate symporter
MLSYGTQLERVSQLERELAADPAEQEVMALMAFRAAVAERKLRDVRAAMAEDEQLQLQRIAALRAENAPLARIQRAEREFAQRPRTEAQARRLYQRERDSSLARAERLGGMPPQTLPFASFGGSAHAAGGDAAADAAGGDSGRRSFDATRMNFIALVLCLMMGTAAMPHVLTRYYTTPSVSQARRSVAWSLFFITLLYVAAPALAVLVKFEVLQHVVGVPIDELPAWVSRWSRLDPGLVSVRDVNGDGLLQFGELMMAGDVIVLAAPEIGGLPYWVTCLVAVGGMAAALSTADGLLLTVANAFSHDVYYRVIRPGASAAARVIASKVLVMVIAFVAALTAALKITDILQFVSAAFSLAAAAFFPALVLGIFWRRANRAGATAGMLAGLGVCAWYMGANLPLLRAWLGITRPLADTQWWGVEPIAAGVFGVPVGFAVMVVVSLLTARPDAAALQLLDRIRLPQPGER